MKNEPMHLGHGMDKVDLNTSAAEQTSRARAGDAGRAAVTVFGGGRNTLRQTLIALVAGSELSEHENPGEATLQVLSGRVRLVGDSGFAAEGAAGELLVIPDERHRLEAVEDSTVLLTVGKR
jgi:quercetin dioxygenase-like cupin family protein